MIKISEYVSAGHPDAVADGIVSYILDRFMDCDPKVRFALECQIKDNFVTLGGEITSTAKISEEEIKMMVKNAVREIGYTEEYAKEWGDGNCIDPSKLEIVCHISQQSPDIAQGVDQDGWGDQGIMWGMATNNPKTNYMPLDHFIARKIGMTIYANAARLGVGIDIKTQVTIQDNKVVEVIVAAPMRDNKPKELIEFVVADVISEFVPYNGKVDITINGTGAYVRHASQGDCGTTGRKLAVDFYGGNCRIGGGCPWGKDPSKADVTLNILAREFAKKQLLNGWVPEGCDTVYCTIGCCIGKKEITVALFDDHLNLIDTFKSDKPAPEVIADLGLNRGIFFCKKRMGLFSE